MKVSEHQDPEWRAALHARLDAVLDSRAALEVEAGVGDEIDNIVFGPRSYCDLATTPVGEKARVLLKEALAITGDAVGNRLRCAALQKPAEDGTQQRAALRDWLSLLEPVLSLPQPTALGGINREPLAEYTVWLALRALDAGEIWPIFEASKRGNRPANLYSLGVARLSALEWKRRLVSLGHSEGDANRQITAAFGEQWDTIRKWEASCAATLGEYFVKASLERANHDEKANSRSRGLFGFLKGGSLASRLQRAGEKYQAQKRRAAELSPSKRKAARRAEK